MINRMIRPLIGLSISGLILHFGSRILVWHSQSIYTVKTGLESLALGICMALLGMLIGSVFRMRIRRILEFTRIEDEIDQTSKISWRSAQRKQYKQVNSQSQQPPFQQRTFVTVDVLPALEVLEENIR